MIEIYETGRNARIRLDTRSIVLTGFMATGKSVVGRVLADRLGREFIDMDALIASREKMSVPTIFMAFGQAYFRKIEAALCVELGKRSNLVIATGGGTLVSQTNREAFAASTIVCLDANAAEILTRIGDPEKRPMLGGAPPWERVAALLDARRDAYASIPLHVDTTVKSINEVADEVLTICLTSGRPSTDPRAKAVATNAEPAVEVKAEVVKPRAEVEPIVVTTPEGTYSIFVGRGLLDEVGSRLKAAGDLSQRCAVITNPIVGGLYSARVRDSLEAAGFRPIFVELPEGERHKTLATLGDLYDRLIDAGLDRRSPVIALGGGVVGDLTGLAAATFLRGVPFVQVPTTLLSMVDSSIGGKVAADHPGGKNLVGAFKQPYAVIADTDTLGSLPIGEWTSGLAEVVKHAIIADPALFAQLRDRGATPESAPNWLPAALMVKREVVQRDPFEEGERANLNLGHTFGHAIEKLADFRLRHGDGVAIGIVCAANLAVRLGLAKRGLPDEIVSLFGLLEMPHRVPDEFSTSAIIDAMSSDKKRVNGKLRFVLPRAIGDVVVVGNVSAEDVAAAIDVSR